MNQGTTEAAAASSGHPGTAEALRARINLLRRILIATGILLAPLDLAWGCWNGGIYAVLAAMGVYIGISVKGLLREGPNNDSPIT